MAQILTRVKLSVVFLFCGFLIFALPLILLPEFQLISRISVLVIFIVATFALRRRIANKNYFLIGLAFSIATLVVFLDYLLYSNWSTLGITGSRIDQYVLAKVLSTILIVVPILILTKVSGQKMTSLYLSKGNLKLGLAIGIILFTLFLATSIPAATLLYGGKNLTYSSLIGWAPWVFTFVLANGIREELLFRGLFLKKYQVFLGLGLSNFLQSVIFILPHFNETYSPVMTIFLAITFFLGLAFGAITQRTNSILSSILFHAGADIPVILGIFSNF